MRLLQAEPRKLLPLWLECRDQHMGGFFASHLILLWQDVISGGVLSAAQVLVGSEY